MLRFCPSLLKLQGDIGSKLYIISLNQLSIMQELLRDPDTMPFLKGRKVSMGLLKKEIDRRFTNIRNMLLEPSYSDRGHYNSKSQGCQTDTARTLNLQPLYLVAQPNVLTPKNTNQTIKEKRFLQKHRTSLPWGGNKAQNHRKQQSLTNINDNNTRIKVSEYLTNRKDQKENLSISKIIANNEVEQGSDNSNEKNFIQNSQDDRIFSSLEFTLHNSFKMTDSLIEPNNNAPRLYINIGKKQLDESVSLDGSFSSNSDEQGNFSRSTAGKRMTSLKKVRITERTALPEPQKRIIASEECKIRLLGMMDFLVPIRRREPADNKLRSNVIRKIEERYGDYYDNI